MRRHAKRTYHDKSPSCAFHVAIALLASVYFLDIFATLFVIPELKGEPQTDNPPIDRSRDSGHSRGQFHFVGLGHF